MLGNPKAPAQAGGLHDALEDARWHRDVYLWLRNYEAASDSKRARRERERLLGEISYLVRSRD